LLLALLEKIFEFEADVEMIFDRGLAAARDDDDIANPRMQSFFHAILNNRLVHERQHLLRLRLGGGEKAGPETRCGENCFANFRGWHSLLIFPGIPKNRNSRSAIRDECPAVRRAGRRLLLDASPRG